MLAGQTTTEGKERMATATDYGQPDRSRPITLGVFAPKTEHQTEPNRNRTKKSVGRFFGSLSISSSVKFGVRLRLRFLCHTEPEVPRN